ncbi:hypothetical protein QFZ91_001567 [Paraburkholderia sp. JPY419]
MDGKDGPEKTTLIVRATIRGHGRTMAVEARTGRATRDAAMHTSGNRCTQKETRRVVSMARCPQQSDRTNTSMAQQKTNPKLEQALTRGDLAIRQANSARATALLRALAKMIVDASATIGVEAFTLIHDGDKIYDPADGLWPQALLISLDGPVEDADPDELRTVRLIADDPATVFRVEWQRADGKIGRHEGGPFATVAFISDVDIPWTDDED